MPTVAHAIGYSAAMRHQTHCEADLGYGVDGVLGMNFPLDYNIEIRPAERRIFVERIHP